MKSRTLLFFFSMLIAFISYAQNPGTVLSYTKVSDTEGNFTGVLDDGDYFGRCVNIGDLNKDGITDIAVGATSDDDGGTDKGAVWILFMKADGTVNSHQKISDTEGNFTGILGDDKFGVDITPLGDLDNDNIIDIAVGAYYDDDASPNSGAVWILFLNTDGTVKSHQKISATQGGIVGLTANRFFGLSLTSIGDLDNDGNNDLAVGSPTYDDDGGLYRGCVWILFLKSDGTVKAQQKINDYHGNFAVTLEDVDRFGYGLENIGDLNNDGIDDITVCSLLDDDGGTDKGAVYVLFLDTNGTVKQHQKISDTEGSFAGTLSDEVRFGYSVTSLGDIDGDAKIDIAVSAHHDDDGGTDRGAIFILFMNTDGTVKSYQKISDTEGNFDATLDNDDGFGIGLTSLGDWDNDGNIEIAVGALADDDGGFGRGAFYILTIKTESNSIDENNIAETISIYPNPTSGLINIELEEDFDITIIDISGKIISTYTTNHNKLNTINFSDKDKGMYFIKFSNNKYSFVKKIIVE